MGGHAGDQVMDIELIGGPLDGGEYRITPQMCVGLQPGEHPKRITFPVGDKDATYSRREDGKYEYEDRHS